MIDEHNCSACIVEARQERDAWMDHYNEAQAEVDRLNQLISEATSFMLGFAGRAMDPDDAKDLVEYAREVRAARGEP